MLKRKMDAFLREWKANPDRMPLIIKGARQIGKTSSIVSFAGENYRHAVVINFALQESFRDIFNDGFEVDSILKNISLKNPDLVFVPHETLIFFDEMQACPNCATSLKSFKIDGRYDVICSGSLMGINYQEIESNSVGYKEDCLMHSLDFEEFLWAKGYRAEQIESLYQNMKKVQPLSELELKTFFEIFHEYMVLGGMPAVVQLFVKQKNYSGTLKLQRQLLLDYEEDITKYAAGLDKGKIKNVYSHISTFLGKENKKFQITKVADHARSREYAGTIDWLNDAGIVNVCYSLNAPELPLKGNYDPRTYKLYYRDTGLLVASLDEEAGDDLRLHRNFNTYKGALYENVVADMLVKQDYSLFYYKNEKSTLEMDFFVRDATSLVPIEVKANDGATASLNSLIRKETYGDVQYGIKFCYKNIGFNGLFYTFPYFLTPFLKRFLKERIAESVPT